MELIAKGYVGDEGKPLALAMALAHDNALPGILREAVDHIVAELISEAKRCNARLGARIFVERIELFGSTLRNESDYGDVDIVVHLTEPTEDFTPEDMEEQGQVSASLQAVPSTSA